MSLTSHGKETKMDLAFSYRFNEHKNIGKGDWDFHCLTSMKRRPKGSLF